MNTAFTIQKAPAQDAPEIASMVGELLAEIMENIGEQVFHFDLIETTQRLSEFLTQEKYIVFTARDLDHQLIGFISLCESYALYAGGCFGIIPEFYISKKYRSKTIGYKLISQAKTFGISRGWQRLEVTTPPLPHFNKTLAFYEREGFSVSGGCKLKYELKILI